jgi:Uma2 family endonuclease
MRLPARQRFSFDEYLLLEEIAEVKHEFLDGEVWAMAGGSPEHAAVIGNVAALLNVQLRGQRCRVHSTELRVRVRRPGWEPTRMSRSSAAAWSGIPTTAPGTRRSTPAPSSRC